MNLAIELSHKHWNECVNEHWASLRDSLDALMEYRCEHEEGTGCIPCNLERRMTFYGFLWADFVESSASEATKRLQVKEMALLNAKTILAAKEYPKDGKPCPSKIESVRESDEAVLKHLEKL